MNEENKLKLAVLKEAQKHQVELLEQGVLSSLLYYEWDLTGWEFVVEYLDVDPDGDTQMSFDVDSISRRHKITQRENESDDDFLERVSEDQWLGNIIKKNKEKDKLVTAGIPIQPTQPVK